MITKNCEECRAGFEPSRKTQRFCSTRCADRQRDRRRRFMAAVARPAPRALVRDWAAATASIPASPRHKTEPKLTAAPANSSQLLDSLRTQLRAQSVDIDHLEAENAEQRAVVRSLRINLARLQTVQQADAQDLVHLAGRLLALSQAIGVELDNSTKALFRRRGWMSTSYREVHER